MPTLVLAFMLWLTGPAQTDGSLPVGYRMPEKADYIGQWQDNRAKFPVPFHVRADFNGDSVPDDAWILLTGSQRAYGFFVHLASRQGTGRWIKLDDGAYAQASGLAAANPGRYKTGCRRGFGSGCGPNEPSQITLVRPAIEYFEFEGASSYFWWDVDTKTFQRTRMTD